MKRFILVISALLALSSVSLAHAACDVDAINRVVAKSLPKVVFDEARKAPIRGLCEALIDTEVFYISEKGDYLFFGNMVAVKSGDNLTQERRAGIVKKIIDGQDEARMIVMGPDNPVTTITVFTDVDCPYCAKFHEEVPALNQHGVKVRYLLYPRNGISSPTYQKSVSVWCADDRIKAIGIAKGGGSVPRKSCDNPVADHYRLGARLNITGTPTLILEDGTKVGGYMPAARLLAALGLSGATSHPVTRP